MENSHAIQNGVQLAIGQAFKAISQSADMWAILTQYFDKADVFMPIEHSDGRWQVGGTFYPTFAQAFADVMERYDAAMKGNTPK